MNIAICVPYVEEQAKQKGKTTDEVIVFLFDHGMEHLLGHHHD